MKTDIYLKRLAVLCGAEILDIFDVPAGELVRVETLEMPASAKRLDTLLFVRSPQGQEYLHVIEWLGYQDLLALWRLMQYVAWLGQNYHGMTIVATIVYLTPTSDMGDTLEQSIRWDAGASVSFSLCAAVET